ncbi:hypothetical protein DCAR_0206959 [Daucus carota subsp. sativus]|uniref:DUF4219 domain-containing protein n=1 Tax=Daucus carota subsp. sativus TaxID=79200 RepID=A0AAF0WGI2_DAUCS|nr:hypothetical protein DCAR_0206959 [Daucus carota subsp. sativus]
MKTLLKSQDLWDMVETGYKDKDEESKLRENKKKDSKALVIIQQAVHDSVFARIAAASTSKQAWSILQKEFQGDSKVKVKQTLNLVKVIDQGGEAADVEDFVVVVEVLHEPEAGLMHKGSPMSSGPRKIAFNAIIAKVLDT